MAAVVLLEEQHHHNMATFEEDAEFEEDDDVGRDALSETAQAFAASSQLRSGMLQDHSELEEDSGPGDASEDTEEDEYSEEVGAVKIQPGQLDEYEDVLSATDDESSASMAEDEDDSKNSTDAEVEIEWVPAAEEEEEEELEPANPNRCIFCHLDEDSDPGEDFELYLACGICGDNAHRQCARDADALASDEVEVWYCPECVTNKLVPGSGGETEDVEDPTQEEIEQVNFDVDPTARRISRDRVPGDLLPAMRGLVKPDSHSVFNQLIAPDDPMDGTRLLRKRKSSNAEVEVESPVSTRRGARSREKNTTPLASAPAPSQNHAAAGELDDVGSFTSPLNKPLVNGMSKPEPKSAPRSSRSLRIKPTSSTMLAVIMERSATSLRLRFRVDPVQLQQILSLSPKPKKKRNRGATRTQASRATVPGHASLTYSQPFYALHEKELDELKSKPYGGILSEADADTTVTLPTAEHRRQFDKARQQAEENWKLKTAKATEEAARQGLKKARKVSGPASQIEYIDFGQYSIDIWYAAPYPEEYSRNRALFICEFCLKYMESDIVAWRHKTKCPWKHPPGDEIYRDGKIMIFEVDGRKNPLYCQNLCLLAKLFLGSKTLYYDVEPFLFYVMTEYDDLGCHFVGYFSKEKRPSSLNNVSCILVLPIHQRKGYGHLLIDFSYLLTRVEMKTGSPEKPLSDMGLVSYRNYWRLVLSYKLQNYKPKDRIPSVKTISDDLGLTPDDVVSGLEALGALVREPSTGTYAFKLQTEHYKEVIRLHEAKNYATLNEKSLVWTPYIMGRGNTSAFEHAPLSTVAPREEDEDALSQGLASTIRPDFERSNGVVNGDGKANADSFGKMTIDIGKPTPDNGDDSSAAQSSSSLNGNITPVVSSYFETAASIPAQRFKPYPPPAGSRKSATSRSSAPKSVRPRTAPSASRSTARRPSSSRRTSSSTRPRSRSSRRPSGGTGRGPGRWPKGTKKTDFENERSGPGLPPKVLQQTSNLGNEVLLGDEAEDGEGEEDDQSQDEAAEETPAPSRARRELRGTGKPLLLAGLGKGKGKGKGKGVVLGLQDIDTEMIDADALGDLDADGEDEE